MKADVSRPTARKYLGAVQPPNELQAKHDWRTRQNPLEEIWPQAEVMLEEAAELEAKALLESLGAHSQWAVAESHLRTFQRRVKRGGCNTGRTRKCSFCKTGRPVAPFNWTRPRDELAVRKIVGQPYEHLLCHSVLPHSNWESATRCLSESMLSLRQGLQEALHSLGHRATGIARGQQQRGHPPGGRWSNGARVQRAVCLVMRALRIGAPDDWDQLF